MQNAGISQPWGVTAYGAASVKAAPDLARANVAVTTLKPTPEDAFADGQHKVAALRAVLRRHEIPEAAVSGSQLRLTSEYTYGNERRFLGYQCKAEFTIETTRLDAFQTLLVDVVGAGVNQVDRVEFDVQAKKELRAEARRKAVRAAREKAELYVEAAGVALGDLLHIEDVDPEGVRTERYRSHSSAGSSAEEDLAPGHVVVSAAVMLGFALT